MQKVIDWAESGMLFGTEIEMSLIHVLERGFKDRDPETLRAVDLMLTMPDLPRNALSYAAWGTFRSIETDWGVDGDKNWDPHDIVRTIQNYVLSG